MRTSEERMDLIFQRTEEIQKEQQRKKKFLPQYIQAETDWQSGWLHRNYASQSHPQPGPSVPA